MNSPAAPVLWVMLPVWVVCACLIAVTAERYAVTSAGTLALMLLAVATPLTLSRICLADIHLRWLVVVCLVFSGYMLVPNILEPVREVAWWRLPERAAALLAFLAVVASGRDSREVIRWCGAAAAIGVLMSLAVDWLFGSLSIGFFAFGHPNYLVNPAGPAVLGWSLLLAYEWRAGVRPRWSELGLLVAAWATLTWFCWVTGRRGMPVALIGGVATMAWFWLWKTRPRLAAWLVVVVAVLAIASLYQRYQTALGGYRQERLLQYWATWETALAKLPWGGGSYAEADIIITTATASRHMTATGGYALHAHNEPLDVLVCGGIPGILLYAIIVGLVAWRVARMIDGGLQFMWCGIMGAVAVHLLTDPTFGQDNGQAWLGVLLGGLFLAPARALRWPSPWLPSIKVLAWPLSAVCVWGTSRSLYPALVQLDASPEVHFKAGMVALHPQWADLYLKEIIHGKGVAQGEIPKLLDIYERKMGPYPDVIGLRALLVPQPTPAAELANALELIRCLPFDRRGYAHLSTMVAKDAALTQDIPARVLVRLRRLESADGMPVPDVRRPISDIDTAIDLFSECVWLLDRNLEVDAVETALDRLSVHYGNVPDIAQLCLEAAIAYPQRYDWIQQRNAVLSEGAGKRIPELSLLIRTPAEAAAAGRYFHWLFPGFFSAFAAHRLPAEIARGGVSADYLALLRIWNLENQRRWQISQSKP